MEAIVTVTNISFPRTDMSIDIQLTLKYTDRKHLEKIEKDLLYLYEQWDGRLLAVYVSMINDILPFISLRIERNGEIISVSYDSTKWKL